MDERGPLILLEGMVGCGKSTQLKAIEERLKERNIPYDYGREPGGVPLSEEIRKLLLDPKYKGMIPVVEVFLFEAARAQFYEEKVRPTVESGRAFISDRSYWSTVAFQGYGRGFPLDKIDSYNRDAVNGLDPDITFILDAENVKDAVARARRTSAQAGLPDRFEDEEIKFHTKVRDGYRAITRNSDSVVLIPHFEHEENVPTRIQNISKYLVNELDKFLDSYGIG